MPRGRTDDESTLHWTERQKEELLMQLTAYNRTANGRKPNSKTWEDWAKELQDFFKDQVIPAKVQQMKVRLKSKFDHELMLCNNTGLDWDPITGAVTCTDECRGGTIPVADEEGATSDKGGSDDCFVTTMRAGLNNAARGLNVALSSKAIGKKSTKSSRRVTCDLIARELIGRLVSSIENKHSSRTKSSAENQVGASDDLQDYCQEIVKEMAIDDDTAISVLEAITWYPNVQKLFVRMSESQRTLFVTKTINTSWTQTCESFSYPHTSTRTQFMQPPFPNFMSQPTNYMQLPPFFGQQLTNNMPRPPNFGGPQPIPPMPNIPQNYNSQQPAAYSPQIPYYMPHFPPQPGHFGSDGSPAQL